MFDHFSKQLEIRPKYSATSLIFKSLLGVWKCGQTRSFVFDILLKLHSFMSNITRKNICFIFAQKYPRKKGILLVQNIYLFQFPKQKFLLMLKRF